MIGAYLKKYRTEGNVTTKRLAEYLKVSQSYVSQIENEKKIPSVKKLFEITECIAACSIKEKCEQDGLNSEEYYIEYQTLASSYIDEIIKNINLDSIHRYPQHTKILAKILSMGKRLKSTLIISLGRM